MNCSPGALSPGEISTPGQQPQRGLQILPSLMMIPCVVGAGAAVMDVPESGVAEADVGAITAAMASVGSANRAMVRRIAENTDASFRVVFGLVHPPG